MRAAAVTACADGDSVNTLCQWDVGIGGRALGARLIADIVVGGAQGCEQRRIRAKVASRAAAEEFLLEFELPFRAVTRGFHFVANAGGDAVAQSGFEASEFGFAFRA